MYQGRYYTRNTRKRRNANKKIHILLASIVLILGISIGTTMAFLADDTESVTNTFVPAKAEVTVSENFDQNIKTNIGATNSSDFSAYVRITLVEYWKKDGKIVPKPDLDNVGVTKTPGDTEGDNAKWIEKNGIYYYKQPLAPNSTTKTWAINKVEATVPEGYTYHLDVYAEAIQAEPTSAVVAAWGVVLDDTDKTTITAVN